MTLRAQTPGVVREHEHEPQHGLPELLPAGERVLWQGSPDWRSLARHAFHLRKLTLYFALLLLWRGAVAGAAGGWAAGLWAALMLLPLPAVALGLVALVARWSAQGAVYTITNRRVVMRIGIVLTVSFNLPLTRIAAAGLAVRADGSGDIPLTLGQGDRIAWLHLWPHVRPWRVARPEPMLRSVPNAAAVARVLTDAWVQATGGSAAPAPAAAPAPQPARQPAMATR